MKIKKEKIENLKIYLAFAFIAIFAAIIRLRHIELCDILDRGQFVMGMTLYHPPGYHWFTTPITAITGGYHYSGAVTNVILCIIMLVVLYKLGEYISNKHLGLLFALCYAFMPVDILFSRYISNETLELFFYTLVAFFYIKIEIFGQDTLINKVLLFLAVALGAFSKTQSLFFVIPLCIYGLYKHRLQIFKKDTYYLIGLGLVPFFMYLFAHPELLAAIPTYFSEPAIEWGVLGILLKFKQLFFGQYVIYMLPFLLLSAAHLTAYLAKKIKYTNIEKEANKFMLVMFFTINMILIGTQPKYSYLLTIPLVYFSALLLFKIRWKIAATLMILTVLFVSATYFFIIPSYSILTLNRCELSLGVQQESIIDQALDVKNMPQSFFHKNIDQINVLIKDEKYIILGGAVGQDFKPNINKRTYYPQVMNSPRFKDINYAMLVYPIAETYRGAPLEDHEYLNWLVENSDVVFEGMKGTRKVQILKITNHDFVHEIDPDFIQKSRESLAIPYVTT